MAAFAQLKVTEEIVTPDRAKHWLANMKNDRPFSSNTAAMYAEVMRRNEWKFNGDPVRLNTEGKLMDGQHRMHAIVNSGKAQKMLIVSGLDSSVFDTIDVGKKRSAGDLLGIAGYTHGIPLASATRALLIYESGALWAEQTAKLIDYQPTGKQIVAYVHDNPEVYECVRNIYNVHNYATRLVAPSAIGLAYILAHRHSKSKAEQFINGFVGNEPTERTDARWVAREYMSRQRNEAAVHKLTSNQMQAVMIKAANFFFAGIPASTATLRFQPGKHWFPRFDGGKKDAREYAKKEREAKSA